MNSCHSATALIDRAWRGAQRPFALALFVLVALCVSIGAVDRGAAAERRQFALSEFDRTSPRGDEFALFDRETVRTETWSRIELRRRVSDETTEIVLLRPNWWLERSQVVPGGEVWIEAGELGVSGRFRVEGVEPCEIDGRVGSTGGRVRTSAGPRVVTGKFSRIAAVFRVEVETTDGRRESIGTTRSHPFFSLDRSRFVQAGDLRDGERLRCAVGDEVSVRSVRPTGQRQVVHNLEVQAVHTFYVGRLGVLVHNNCGRGRPQAQGSGYATERHGPNRDSQWSSTSQFDSESAIDELIEESNRHPGVTQPNGNTAITFDAGREIGFDRNAGNRTNTVTVTTRPCGRVVTAFPGAP